MEAHDFPNLFETAQHYAAHSWGSLFLVHQEFRCDAWERAQMPEVLQYLRGGAGISILVPEEWEGYLPKSPPEPPTIVD